MITFLWFVAIVILCILVRFGEGCPRCNALGKMPWNKKIPCAWCGGSGKRKGGG